MPSYSIIVLTLSAAAAAAPLAARSNICGIEPSVSVSSSKAPLQTYTNANTAEECHAKCGANNSCKSFIFGLVDNAIKCDLFDCIASQIPVQESANLVAFDKGCSSIPDIKPTTSNPQGLAISKSETSYKSNTSDNSKSEQKTEPTSNTDKSTTNVSQKQAVAAKDTQKATQKTESNTSKSQQSESKKTTTATSTTIKLQKCAAAPVGTSTDIEPFNTPSNIASLDACVAACKKNSSCNS